MVLTLLYPNAELVLGKPVVNNYESAICNYTMIMIYYILTLKHERKVT